MDKNFEYKFDSRNSIGGGGGGGSWIKISSTNFSFSREREGMYIHIHREAYKLYKYDTAVNHSEAYAYVSPAFPSRLKF